MAANEEDMSKLYDDLMAFDHLLELLEPINNDGAPAGRGVSTRRFSGGIELVCNPGDDGDEEKKPTVAGTTESEKMAEVKAQFKMAVKSTIGQIVLLLIFSFLGAALLYFTESYQENENIEVLSSEKASVVADIINKVRTTPLNETYETQHNVSQLPIAELRKSPLWNTIDELVQKYVDSKESLHPYPNSPGWTFWGALFFCWTIYTTVGYGNVYPLTTEGRVITIFYAAIGIPLCLVVMMNLGKTFTHAIKFLWSFVRRFYYTGSCRRVRCMIPKARLKMSAFQRFKHSIRQQTRRMRNRGGFRRQHQQPDDEKARTADDEECTDFVPYEVDDTFNLPVWVALLIAFIYMMLGSLMYHAWETNWSYFEAFYFVFISLSTIGLGDVMPYHPKYFLATSLYLIIGLAVVAMVINVFMEMMNISMSKATNRVLSSRPWRIVLNEETIKKIAQQMNHSTPPGGSEEKITSSAMSPTLAEPPPPARKSIRRGSV